METINSLDVEISNTVLVTNTDALSESESYDESQSIPSRIVICDDAITWLQNIDILPGSVFTSLPDISEIPEFNGILDDQRINNYKIWFHNAVSLIFTKLPPGGYAIFLQSDVRVINHNMVTNWIDKSYLCSAAAESSNLNMKLIWHKNVLTSDINKISINRPTFSHLLCFGKDIKGYEKTVFATPDTLTRGPMVWPRGIGLDCCLLGVSFLLQVAQTTTIVDPFCGHGTVLAVANAVGCSSLGVELSPKRCRKARILSVIEELASMPESKKKKLGYTQNIHHLINLIPRNTNIGVSKEKDIEIGIKKDI